MIYHTGNVIVMHYDKMWYDCDVMWSMWCFASAHVSNCARSACMVHVCFSLHVLPQDAKQTKRKALPDVDIIVATPLMLCSLLKPCAGQFGRYIAVSLPVHADVMSAYFCLPIAAHLSITVLCWNDDAVFKRNSSRQLSTLPLITEYCSFAVLSCSMYTCSVPVV